MDWRGSITRLFFLVAILAPPATSVTQPNSSCSASCGAVSIPFPFGTSPDCYLNPSFLITCNDTHFSPSRPFLGQATNAPQVLDITLDGQMRVSASVARNCYNQAGGLIVNETRRVALELPNFFFSSTKNKFMGVGCDTVAVVVGTKLHNYTAGCISLCSSLQNVVNGSCSGFGCCQSSIQKEARNFGIGLASLNNHTNVWEYDPCSYAFLGEAEAFNFTMLDLEGFRNREAFPVVLDWAVGNETCQEAQTNPSSFACQAINSECFNSTNGPGYFCGCSSGYQGNPYLVDGCQDINECQTSNPCNSSATCTNLQGSFSCSCLKGLEGDGLRNGTGCWPRNQSKGSTLLIIALGVTIGLLALVVAGSWIYWIQRKRKIIKLREKFFQQNGGLLLQQKISGHEGSSADQTARIFTAEDLKKATNNYNEDRVIGQGGYGTVYKGILPDNGVVAIKKSKISDESQTEQFINEVIVLSQINHRNVVKLIGCCLETEVPLLVYEFITNGSLSDRIHEDGCASPLLTWEMRLKIAAETAEALAYLHSATSVPIIHRDIKSANILLDDMYSAKVSDFGASRLVPLDQTQLATMVQGTFGYLDPEYFHSSQLTEKSDVYSFGVVLVELLTSKKALSFDRPDKDRNLATYFVCAMKEDQLIQILDSRVLNRESLKQMQEVAKLAQRCLRLIGDDRPTMKEVAMELEGLRKMGRHPWVESDLYPEETKQLLEESVPSVDYNGVFGTGNGYSVTAGYDSLRDHMIVQLDGGR